MCLKPKLINPRFVEQQSQILDHFIWRMVGAWPLAKYCRNKCCLNILANTFYKAWMSPVLGSEGLSVSNKSWQTVLFTWQELGRIELASGCLGTLWAACQAPVCLTVLGGQMLFLVFSVTWQGPSIFSINRKRKKKPRTNNFAITRKKN